MDLRTHHIDDVSDHCVAWDGWTQTYDQLSSGNFLGKLVQFEDSDFRYFRESTNQRVLQQGQAPHGFASIAMPLDPATRATFQDRPVNGLALLTLSNGESFRFHTPHGLEYIGISLSSALIDPLLASIGTENALSRFREHVLPVDHERTAETLLAIRRLLDDAETAPSGLRHPLALKQFRDEMISLMLDLFASSCAATPSRTPAYLTHRTYSDIVKRSEQIVRESPAGTVSILDLCQALRCSRRTLQTSFQHVAQIAPLAYLRTVRLNAVRHALRKTRPDVLSIGDAAEKWGFSHLSYFSRDYRTLFGELPSHTARPR